ncbi:hypothetical protein IBTHAUMO2_570004 [Nitrosopumilaceae archaeon]|nr:Fic family protein [Alphaproteobacteria bacterium]CAI9832048.1 hypothetical protein IBTHAUMO2_570004 [Nitrosopumilaceae archaeon]
MTEDWSRRITWIHDRIVRRYGIRPGFLTKGAAESLVQKIDLPRPDTFKTAAMLMEGLTRLHPFIDGNKRTAPQSGRDYLKPDIRWRSRATRPSSYAGSPPRPTPIRTRSCA